MPIKLSLSRNQSDSRLRSLEWFPMRIADSIIKPALQSNDSNTIRSKKANVDSIKIFFNLKYWGETAERMIKSCIKKLYKSFKREINVKFVTHYKTTKISLFTNTKDKTPRLSQLSVVYKFTWTEKHAHPNKKSNKQSAIYEHLSTCPNYSHIVDLLNVNNHVVN